ncbi:MAG: hypothetical protein HWN65_01245, partial [Candidatus Helarchaeota archaeon]|nr:hypothetical protein [Candidatus Helarchaeota archaeon]
MNQKKGFLKKSKGIYKRHSIYYPFILLSIVILMVLTYAPLSEPESVSTNEFNSPLMTLESSNSKPLLVSHHTTIINEYLAQTLPTNVSFTLVEGWVSKNTTIYYDGVSKKTDLVINGSFDTGLEPWDNISTQTNIQIIGWDSGSAQIDLTGGPLILDTDYGLYYENISVQEILTPNKLITFSMDYFYNKGGIPPPPTFMHVYMAVVIGNIEKNYTIGFPYLVQDGWNDITITYNPASIGQELPNNISFKVGVCANDSGSIGGLHHLWIDNVAFKIWTNPNQTNFIFTKDCESGLDYNYQNTTFGVGQTFIGVEKDYQETTDVICTIFNNMTDVIDVEIENITMISNAFKITNSTVDGVPGSIYQTNGLIRWQTEWDIDIPFNYFNSWIEIEKPVDWNVTLILDGYDNDQIGQCTGTGFGSNGLNIPNTIVGEGLWILEAESYNYILDGFISVWNGTDFENGTNFYVGDIFQITVVLNNTLSLTNTQTNCTIQYPNDTLLIQETQEPSSAIVIFGNYTVGLNMSLGTYPVMIEWVNNLSTLERDKVGFTQLEFNVIHTTNLTAVESYIEKVAGVPTLVKVKFEDLDLNITIPLAEVTYNSTYGASGTMAYIGSGIYMAELNTAALTVGDYYLSFNASKVFYQNLSIGNLIHLKIRPESLVLEVPRQVKNVTANSYAYYKINVTGEISGLFLSPANITIDWTQNYTVSDFGNGTYGLNLSTFEVTSGAVPETFTIPLTANKTDYGSTSDILLLKVYPIPAQIGVNATVIQVPYGNQFYIRANYTVVATNQSISGATCNVTWTSSYDITPIGDDFLIIFNTTGLSIDVHTVLIQMSHLGYETEIKSILVTITPIPTQIGINTTFVAASLGDIFYVRANYTVEGSNELISGANCTVTWAAPYNITSIGDEFIITFNTSGLSADIHMALIRMDYPGYETALENIFVSISPIPAEIGVNSTLVAVTLTDTFYIRVNYTEEGTSNLIAGATCNVTWAASYNITPVGDEFIVTFNTTGLSTDVYTALIQMSHPNYETTLESVLVSISPIPAEIGVNATLVQITLNDVFYIRVNYTEEGTSNLIAGATCNVTWAASYN